MFYLSIIPIIIGVIGIYLTILIICKNTHKEACSKVEENLKIFWKNAKSLLIDEQVKMLERYCADLQQANTLYNKQYLPQVKQALAQYYNTKKRLERWTFKNIKHKIFRILR